MGNNVCSRSLCYPAKDPTVKSAFDITSEIDQNLRRSRKNSSRPHSKMVDTSSLRSGQYNWNTGLCNSVCSSIEQRYQNKRTSLKDNTIDTVPSISNLSQIEEEYQDRDMMETRDVTNHSPVLTDSENDEDSNSNLRTYDKIQSNNRTLDQQYKYKTGNSLDNLSTESASIEDEYDYRNRNLQEGLSLNSIPSLVHNCTICPDSEQHTLKSLDISEAFLDSKRNELVYKAKDWPEQLKTIHKSNLDSYEKIYQDKDERHGLRIYFNTYEVGGFRINRTRSEWVIPFRAEQFLNLLSSPQEQKNIIKNIDEYVPIESFGTTYGAQYRIYYLSYKKIMMASSRDFVFMKFTKRMNENVWCDVSKSIIHSDYSEKEGKVRGEMILNGYIVKEFVDSSGKIKSKVKLYSETDFKINVPVFMEKNFVNLEMKKFTEACLNRLKQLHPEK